MPGCFLKVFMVMLWITRDATQPTVTLNPSCQRSECQSKVKR